MRITWQQVTIITVIVVAVVATLLVAPLVGASDLVVRYAVAIESTLGVLVAWVLRSPLSASYPSEPSDPGAQ